jgi:hypothetical protein
MEESALPMQGKECYNIANPFKEENTMPFFKKDMPAAEAASAPAAAEAEPVKKKPGRPKGSGKKPGRPKGSGKKPGRPKGKPGRPKGSGKRGRKPGATLKAGAIAKQVAKALKAQKKEQQALITKIVDKAIKKALKQALR